MFSKSISDLWNSVESSNSWWIFLLTISAVFLICLFAARNMVVLRVYREEFIFPSQLQHSIQQKIPQMHMMKVHIPFTFKLLETSKSSYSDLQCSISSQVNYRLLAYWGVNIKELHIFLWRPWEEIKNYCENGNLLKGYYQVLGLKSQKNPHSNKIISLTYKRKTALDLGTPPRIRYPLVIFLIRNDKNIHPDETVALINVVHIKDTVCTLPTSILGQYLKQGNGQLSCLKQLYLATGNSGNYEQQIPLAVAEPMLEGGGPSSVGSFCTNNEDSTFWNSSGEQLCVVCQIYPLSRALLPCRHTCICASCFNKLDRCPMCRGPIKSYFCIRGEEYLLKETINNLNVPEAAKTNNNNNNNNNQLENNRRRWFNGGINWDDRLIDFLGFSR